MTETRDAVLDTIGRIAAGSDETIDRSHLQEWMRADDLVVLGGVYYMLFDGRFHRRIVPALTLDDYLDFTLPYYARCLREDPDLPYASSRYTAGWDLASWFTKLWRDPAVPRDALRRIKSWLAETYLSVGDDVREAIVTATLEHIFEEKGVRRFFRDWESDPLLSRAYADALNVG
jgi:hypothetical protein